MPSKNRNLTPPPPEFLEKPRKRPWHPPTVKTVALDQTFSGPRESPNTTSETQSYFPNQELLLS